MYKAKDIYEAIHYIPQSEPEQTEGIWTECEVFDNADYEIQQWQSMKCSNCGKYHTTPYKYKLNLYQYCPYCGAKMGGD